MKKCSKCHKTKKLAEFWRRYKGKSERQALCKICQNYTNSPRIKERNKERNNEYQRKRRKFIKCAVLTRLGGICKTPGCGCIEFDWLTLSHEANDGKAHQDQLGHSQAVYRWVYKASDTEIQHANLAIRCIRCNYALAFADNEQQLINAIAKDHLRIRSQ